MDLTASSAVNFPMISASLRLVVIWGGSTLCTKAGARVPRLTFTRNFIFVKISPIHSEPEIRWGRERCLFFQLHTHSLATSNPATKCLYKVRKDVHPAQAFRRKACM